MSVHQVAVTQTHYSKPLIPALPRGKEAHLGNRRLFMRDSCMRGVQSFKSQPFRDASTVYTMSLVVPRWIMKAHNRTVQNGMCTIPTEHRGYLRSEL